MFGVVPLSEINKKGVHLVSSYLTSTWTELSWRVGAKMVGRDRKITGIPAPKFHQILPLTVPNLGHPWWFTVGHHRLALGFLGFLRCHLPNLIQKDLPSFQTILDQLSICTRQFNNHDCRKSLVIPISIPSVSNSILCQYHSGDATPIEILLKSSIPIKSHTKTPEIAGQYLPSCKHNGEPTFRVFSSLSMMFIFFQRKTRGFPVAFPDLWQFPVVSHGFPVVWRVSQFAPLAMGVSGAT